MSLETAQKVIVPQKKIMSRIFLNSGTLIVKLSSLIRLHSLFSKPNIFPCLLGPLPVLFTLFQIQQSFFKAFPDEKLVYCK
jgi:hypothetical protein